jgi:hypothetical protein
MAFPRPHVPAALIVATSIAACGAAPTAPSADNLSATIPGLQAPKPAPTLAGLVLLKDREIVSKIIGQKVAGSTTSSFDSYYPDGTHHEERDLGLFRSGRYIVKHDALCTNLREAHWSGCARYYRAPDGTYALSKTG